MNVGLTPPDGTVPPVSLTLEQIHGFKTSVSNPEGLKWIASLVHQNAALAESLKGDKEFFKELSKRSSELERSTSGVRKFFNQIFHPDDYVKDKEGLVAAKNLAEFLKAFKPPPKQMAKEAPMAPVFSEPTIPSIPMESGVEVEIEEDVEQDGHESGVETLSVSPSSSSSSSLQEVENSITDEPVHELAHSAPLAPPPPPMGAPPPPAMAPRVSKPVDIRTPEQKYIDEETSKLKKLQEKRADPIKTFYTLAPPKGAPALEKEKELHAGYLSTFNKLLKALTSFKGLLNALPGEWGEKLNPIITELETVVKGTEQKVAALEEKLAPILQPLDKLSIQEKLAKYTDNELKFLIWIASKSDEKSLRDIYEGCRKGSQDFTAHVLDEVKEFAGSEEASRFVKYQGEWNKLLVSNLSTIFNVLKERVKKPGPTYTITPYKEKVAQDAARKQQRQEEEGVRKTTGQNIGGEPSISAFKSRESSPIKGTLMEEMALKQKERERRASGDQS